ncbi:F-box protein At4g35733-like [Castanea sativa]|uniref:F-box protein At4g35733-like n=1 Tax=Castanea sativa TaxID=21020 RepID=UPI003F6522C4
MLRNVMIYGNLSSLALCKQGDTTWTNFLSENRGYFDIICHDIQLYALRYNCSMEVWEFQSALPMKILSIAPSTTPLKHVAVKLPETKFQISCICSSDTTFGLSTPYRVVLCVQVRFQQEILEKVESLKDQGLFLGGNQWMSLSSHDFLECISNSIYFTDDQWFEMNVDYSYGGHNFGLFNLDDEEIRQFYHYDLEIFDPPPFWITHNPW